MNYKLKILPKAKQDLKEITAWYEKAQKGLGKKFLGAVKTEMNLVKENPLLFQTRYEESKVILVKKFPYLIHFEIIGNEVLVKAVLHTSRDSKNWKDITTD